MKARVIVLWVIQMALVFPWVDLSHHLHMEAFWQWFPFLFISGFATGATFSWIRNGLKP